MFYVPKALFCVNIKSVLQVVFQLQGWIGREAILCLLYTEVFCMCYYAGFSQIGSHLFSKRVNGCQGDGFSSVGTRTGAIRFAMAGTQDWWGRFPPLLGY